jgi:hypothetical protein
VPFALGASLTSYRLKVRLDQGPEPGVVRDWPMKIESVLVLAPLYSMIVVLRRDVAARARYWVVTIGAGALQPKEFAGVVSEGLGCHENGRVVARR